MQFSLAVVAAAAFALTEAAMFTMPPQSFVGIKAGTALNITWSGASGPATILLKNGPATALKTAATIASGQTGNTFIWTPSASLMDDTYAFEIDDASGTPNYSVQFALTGGAASSSASSGSSTASSTGSSSTGSASSTSSGSSTTTSGSSASSTGTASKTSSGSSSASSTSSHSSTTSTAPTTTPTGNTSGASNIASPLAMVLLAFFAMITLN